MPTTEDTQLFGDEVMGFTSSQERQLFGDEVMGFGSEQPAPPQPIQYPGAAVASAMTGAPVSGNFPSQGLETTYRALKGLYDISPIGLSFKTTQAALGAIPIPSQESFERFVKRTRESGGAFGGGFEGTKIPGMSQEESDERSAAFVKAISEQAKGFAEFSATPVGAATMVAGGPAASSLGKVGATILRRLIGAGFTADIARHVPDQYQRYLIAKEHGTPAEQEAATADLGTSVLMLGGLATHQAKGVPEFLGKVPEVFDTARRLGLERAAAETSKKVHPVAKPTAIPGHVAAPTTLAGQRVHHYTNPDIPGAKPQTFMLPADATPETIRARIEQLRAPEAEGAMKETETIRETPTAEQAKAEEYLKTAKGSQELHGTIPAVRIGGEGGQVVTGAKGMSHNDIAVAEIRKGTPESASIGAKIIDNEGVERGFVAPDGTFKTRAQVSEGFGLKQPMTSEDLKALQKRNPPVEPETPAVAPGGPAKAPEGAGGVPIPPAAAEAAQAVPAQVTKRGVMDVVMPKGTQPVVDPRTTAGTPWTPEDIAEYVKLQNTPVPEGQISHPRLEALKNQHGGNPPLAQQVTKGPEYAGQEQGAVGVVSYKPAPSVEAVATGAPSRVFKPEVPRPEAPQTQKVGDQDALQGKEAQTPVVPAEGTPTTTPTSAGAQVPPGIPAGVEGGIPGAPPVPVGPTPAVPSKTGGILSKWVSATEDRPLGSEAGFFTLEPLKEMWDRYSPRVRDAMQAVKEVYSENSRITPTTDRRRGLLEWSGKMQASFNEAAHAQREIETKVRNPVRRDAISNWIEAGGDTQVLQQRLAATQSWVHPTTGKQHPDRKRLIAGYEAALNLTPEELAVAADVKRVYDTLGNRGQSHDVLGNFVDNYVTHVWNMSRGVGKGGGMGSGGKMLKDRFQFAKARTFNTFFDGEQAGWVPKTKDVSKLLPAYMHEMNSVIASRQLVAKLAEGREIDGRPILAAEGVGFPIEGEKGKATLILPDVADKEYSDYVKFPKQPALHAWRWATKDAAGNPVFIRANLAVHPRVAPYLNAAIGKSKIREWYSTRTSALAEIPKGIMRGADWMQAETKRTMLGLLAPFHQVQEGTHAWGHRVNPFWGNPTIDLANNPAQRDAVRHGVMLAPDMASKEMFMEGFRHSGLVSKIPGIGWMADKYSNYLFHDYIPGLKYRTYEKILERNNHLYRKELANGTVKPEDVKILSGEQANAAYGHLNYADLGRSPTMQHFMRLALLAPDFLEARMRFTGQAMKGIAGQKVGREQLVALAFLAASQATVAWTMAQLTDGTWEAKDPFAFHKGNRKYTMRSVPEDLLRLGQDPRAFIYARLNPLLGRGTVQYLSGTDWRGRKVSSWETAKELAMQPMPLTLRALFDTANSPLSEWEQLLASSGIVIKRYSAQAEIRKKVHDWMYDSKDPRIKAAEERYRQETFADSDYKAMREALINNDYGEAAKEYTKLLETKSKEQIDRTMSHPRPMTGNSAWDVRFRASLSAEDRILYEQAKREQRELMDRYLELTRTTARKRPPGKTAQVTRIPVGTQ